MTGAKVVVAARIFFADEAQRDAAVAASTEIQRATRDDEPGCLAYCFAADPADPLAVQVYELWDDSDSLAAHFTHPNYLKMVELLGSANIKESINQAYLVERGEPVYGPNGEKKTGFFQD